MSTDLEYMRLALDQAHRAAQAGEVPVGAVLVHQDPRSGTHRVLATAHNTPIADHDPTAHAEMQALRAAGSALGNYRLDDCTLYVTLEPCPMCAGAMLHARLKRVVYGAADPKTGVAGSVLDLFAHRQLNHQTQVQGGVLADECGALLQNFFQQRRQQARQAAQRDPTRFPLREDALRTPEHRFADLPDFPWTPRYVNDLPSLDGLRLHYLDEGSREETALDAIPLQAPDTQRLTWLCLHGQGDWCYRHHTRIPQLLAQGHRVVALDLIGFGRSDKPKKQDAHSMDWHLRVVQEFVERLNLWRVALLLPGESPDPIAELGRRWARAEPQRHLHTHYAVAPIMQGESAEQARAWNAPFPDAGHRAALRAFAAFTWLD